jgi:hypothetical protein
MVFVGPSLHLGRFEIGCRRVGQALLVVLSLCRHDVRHDLRHEYASRLVERGVPLAQLRDLLGHASILTTERYDNQRLEALQAAVERLEGGKTFDPKIDASDNLSAVAVSTGSAKAEVSRIFQDPTEQSFTRSEDPAKESAISH